MLKIRISGPTYELKDYLEHMEKIKYTRLQASHSP